MDKAVFLFSNSDGGGVTQTIRGRGGITVQLTFASKATANLNMAKLIVVKGRCFRRRIGESMEEGRDVKIARKLI